MTDTDRAILAAAELPWQRREAAAARLGMSATRMHQRLLQLLDNPEVLAKQPVLVSRLRRLRAARRARRHLEVG